MSTNFNFDYPALEGRPVTERHRRVCEERGHATATHDGTETERCPRCDELLVGPYVRRARGARWASN